MSESDESKHEDAPSSAAGEAGEHAAGPRKRRRRRGKKPRDPDTTAGVPTSDPPAAAPANLSATVASLSAGLFSHLDDREEPCRMDGCDRTWTWTAQEQIQGFGQPPPKRMCAVHARQFQEVGDREVACANPGCTRTWTFTKAAQIAQLSRTGSAEPPARACEECIRDEKHLGDREVPCRLDACKRTWTWPREAQLKHRTWLRRHADDPEPAAEAHEGKRRRRRKGKRRASIHEPPPRLCEPCKSKLARLEEREGPCKVHGCTRMASVDKEQQLRAWVALGTEDLDADAPLPRRMCDACREFCRTHPDREVPCGRPGCDKSWTYKTGAQLQAMLAGRHEDPIRLCPECASGDFVRDPAAPPGSEVMPCVVPLCEGVWYWRPGMQLASAGVGDLPLDRMCEACRVARGVQPSAAEAAAQTGETPEPSESVNESSPPTEGRDTATDADHGRDRSGGRNDAPLEADAGN